MIDRFIKVRLIEEPTECERSVSSVGAYFLISHAPLENQQSYQQLTIVTSEWIMAALLHCAKRSAVLEIPNYLFLRQGNHIESQTAHCGSPKPTRRLEDKLPQGKRCLWIHTLKREGLKSKTNNDARESHRVSVVTGAFSEHTTVASTASGFASSEPKTNQVGCVWGIGDIVLRRSPATLTTSGYL